MERVWKRLGQVSLAVILFAMLGYGQYWRAKRYRDSRGENVDVQAIFDGKK
jgi:hypothetical protein